MNKKYLRENKNSYSIVRSSKTFAKISNPDDAEFIRDLLIDYDWNIDCIPQIVKNDDEYMVLTQIDSKLHIVAKYRIRPDEETVKKITKKYMRNPNNSRYGLNISRIDDIFVIRKRIFGDDYIFGYYDDLKDAEFVRNFLMDNDWNVNAFGRTEYDEDTDTYKVVCVIDDIVYVAGTFDSESNIDLNKTYEEFLAKISKHKYGLASYPHLNLLCDMIVELESRFGVKTKDEAWSFDNADETASPLNRIIFNLTPFQQLVFDSIGEQTTFEDIKKALFAYKSKNFDKKIQRNLDELAELGLIEKTGDETYKKTNLK